MRKWVSITYFMNAITHADFGNVIDDSGLSLSNLSSVGSSNTVAEGTSDLQKGSSMNLHQRVKKVISDRPQELLTPVSMHETLRIQNPTARENEATWKLELQYLSGQLNSFRRLLKQGKCLEITVETNGLPHSCIKHLKQWENEFSNQLRVRYMCNEGGQRKEFIHKSNLAIHNQCLNDVSTSSDEKVTLPNRQGKKQKGLFTRAKEKAKKGWIGLASLAANLIAN